MRTATDPGPLNPGVDADGFARYRFAILAGLREQAPAVFVPELHLWAVTRYDTVRAVLADPQRFPSGGAFGASVRLAPAAAALYDLNSPIFRHSLINTDREAHARLKAPLIAAFSAHRIRTLSRQITEDVDELLDGLDAAHDGTGVGGGEVDLRALVSAPLPLGVLCRLFGIPRSDGPAISHESQGVSVLAAPGIPEPVQVDAAGRLRALDTRLRALVTDPDIRATALDDGLIRDILDARDRGGGTATCGPRSVPAPSTSTGSPRSSSAWTPRRSACSAPPASPSSSTGSTSPPEPSCGCPTARPTAIPPGSRTPTGSTSPATRPSAT